MDRRQSSRYGSGRDDDFGDRRGGGPRRDRSPNRGHTSHGHSRSPGRRRSPGRGRSPQGRGRSPGRSARSPRGRSPPPRGRSPVRDRSPQRNRSPIRGGSGRNDYSTVPPPQVRQQPPDSFRSGSYGPGDRGMEPPGPYAGPPGLPGPYAGPPGPDPYRHDDPGRMMMPERGGNDRRPVPPDLMSKLPIPDPSVPVPHCELIITDVNGRQRMYGENVKQRLATSGMSTELVMLRDPGAVVPAVQDAVRRRVLFACVINEQNEMHRSMTVNILHGQLQEHRNMPLDSALTLIVRSFEDWSGDNGPNVPPLGNLPPQGGLPPQPLLPNDGPAGRLPPMQGGGGPRGGPGVTQPAKRPATPDFKRPNENMVRLLQMTIDGRYLVVEELDEIITYLQERRDQAAKDRGMKPGKPPLKTSNETSTSAPSKDVELQRKQLQEKIIKMLEEDPSLANAAKGMLESSGVELPLRNTGSKMPQPLLPNQRQPEQPPQQPHKSILGSYEEQSSWGRPNQPEPRDLGYGIRRYPPAAEPPPTQAAGPSSDGSSGDFRGLQDKIRSLFPGAQVGQGPKAEVVPPAAAGHQGYQGYPPQNSPGGGVGVGGGGGGGNYGQQDWRGGPPPSSAGPPNSGRGGDWGRPAYGGGPPQPLMNMPPPQDFREPPGPQFQQNYRPEGRQFTRFN